jgi:hypothetical protein
MIDNKKEFGLGFVMMGLFIAVLVTIFSPVFNGQNGMQYLDDLYNSISKGSAYYIPKSKEAAAEFNGKAIQVKFAMDDATQAGQIAAQLQKCGAQATAADKEVTVEGDLGAILLASLDDADLMYHNDGSGVSAKYGFNERQALYNWYRAMKGAIKDLNKQEKFDEAKVINEVMGQSIETAYNYYKIIPKKIATCWWIVLGSLVFYVVYTMWYGYAILFMFEGWGMKFGH